MQQHLINYILHLADNVLILSQRNSEWCGHGPVLEQDIAITNISLDLLGQSRNFYQYGALLMNQSKVDNEQPKTEDSLAYLRTEREFKNYLIVELPNGDWGQTILRQFLFSSFQSLLYKQLQNSKDEQLSAIAAKALKEVTYHIKWSGEWVIRLGDGTDESKMRMQAAIENLWSYTGEMFMPSDFETAMATSGIGVDTQTLKTDWLHNIKTVFEEATLTMPPDVFMQQGGKQGIHTEHMGFMLAELQYVQRAYPNSIW